MNGNGSDDAGEPIAEALRLLDLFASVGAEAFDITHTNLQQEKRGFRPAQSLAQARQSMPYLVPSAARRQNNLIVRPRAGATSPWCSSTISRRMPWPASLRPHS
jgi:hypothetical protein